MRQLKCSQDSIVNENSKVPPELLRNIDRLTMVIIEFWPWLSSKIVDRITAKLLTGVGAKWSKNSGGLTLEAQLILFQ